MFSDESAGGGEKVVISGEMMQALLPEMVPPSQANEAPVWKSLEMRVKRLGN